MSSWLTLRLDAPMASFGEEPGNAARGTGSWPTRSALIGLLGAALGVDRADAVGQLALSSQYRFVIRVDQQGTILRDFHTYQSLPSAKGWARTRAEALQHADVVTSITRRDYLCDALFHVAVRSIDEAPRWTLEEISEALKKPQFSLYLGRRSCPLGSPMRPKVVVAASGAEAIQIAFPNTTGPLLHAADSHQDIGSSNRPHRVRRRNDQPLDRTTWTFAGRQEWLEDNG